jgi:tetratricopeptide (TPR) repeat protein
MQQTFQCINCGAPVIYGTGFCGNCGQKLVWTEQQQIQHPMQLIIPLPNIGLINDKSFMASAKELGIAIALINQGKPSKAINYINEFLSMNLNLFIGWWVKGEALGRLGDSHQALECFNRAITLDSFNEDARLSRGLLYIKLGNYSSALLDFATYRRIVPDSLIGYYHEGIAHCGLGEYKLAIQLFDQGIKLISKRENETKQWIREADERTIITGVSEFKLYSALIWTGMAQALINIGVPKKAIECLKMAASIRPSSEAWYNLANLYHSLGNDSLSQQCKDKASEAVPDSNV